MLVELNLYEKSFYKELLRALRLDIVYGIRDKAETILTAEELSSDEKLNKIIESEEFINEYFSMDGTEFILKFGTYRFHLLALRCNKYGTWYITHNNVKYLLKNVAYVTRDGAKRFGDRFYITPTQRYAEILGIIVDYLGHWFYLKDVDPYSYDEKIVKEAVLLSSKFREIIIGALEYHRELYNPNLAFKEKFGHQIVSVRFGKTNKLIFLTPIERVERFARKIAREYDLNFDVVRMEGLEEGWDEDSLVYRIKIGDGIYYEFSWKDAVGLTEERFRILKSIEDLILEKLEVEKERKPTLRYRKFSGKYPQGLYPYKFFVPEITEEGEMKIPEVFIGGDEDLLREVIEREKYRNGDLDFDVAFWGERADIGTTRLLKEKGSEHSVAVNNIPFYLFMNPKRLNVACKNIINSHKLINPESGIVKNNGRDDLEGVNLKCHIVGQNIKAVRVDGSTIPIETEIDVSEVFESPEYTQIETEEGIRIEKDRYMEWIYRTYDAGILISETAARKMRYRHLVPLYIDLQQHINAVLGREYVIKETGEKIKPKRILKKNYDDLFKKYAEYREYFYREVIHHKFVQGRKIPIKDMTAYHKFKEMGKDLEKGIRIHRREGELQTEEYYKETRKRIRLPGYFDEYRLAIIDHGLYLYFESDLKTGDKLFTRTGVKGVCTVVPDEYLSGYEIVIGQTKVHKSAIRKEFEMSKEIIKKKGMITVSSEDEEIIRYIKRKVEEDLKKKQKIIRLQKQMLVEVIPILLESNYWDMKEEVREMLMSFFMGTLFKKRDGRIETEKISVKKGHLALFDELESRGFEVKVKEKAKKEDWRKLKTEERKEIEEGERGKKMFVMVEPEYVTEKDLKFYEFLLEAKFKDIKREYVSKLLLLSRAGLERLLAELIGRIEEKINYGYLYVSLQDAFSWNRTVIREELSLSDNFVENLFCFKYHRPLFEYFFKKEDIIGEKSLFKEYLQYIWRDVREVEGEIRVVDIEKPEEYIKFGFGIRRYKEKLAKIPRAIPLPYSPERGNRRPKVDFFIPMKKFIVVEEKLGERVSETEGEEVKDYIEETEIEEPIDVDKTETGIIAMTKRNPLIKYQVMLTKIQPFDYDFKKNVRLQILKKSDPERAEEIEDMLLNLAVDSRERIESFIDNYLLDDKVMYMLMRKDGRRGVLKEMEGDLLETSFKIAGKEICLCEEKDEGGFIVRRITEAGLVFLEEVMRYIEKINHIFRNYYGGGFLLTLDRIMSGKDGLLHSYVMRGRIYKAAFVTVVPYNTERVRIRVEGMERYCYTVIMNSWLASRLGLKDGDYVLMTREPISWKGNMKVYVVKVRDYKELRNDIVMVNPNVTYSFAMDFDGDTVMIIPLPEKLANLILRETLVYDEVFGLRMGDLMRGEKEVEEYKMLVPRQQYESEEEMYFKLAKQRIDDLIKNIYGVYFVGGKRKDLAILLQQINPQLIDWINIVANVERVGMHKFEIDFSPRVYYRNLVLLSLALQGRGKGKEIEEEVKNALEFFRKYLADFKRGLLSDMIVSEEEKERALKKILNVDLSLDSFLKLSKYKVRPSGTVYAIYRKKQKVPEGTKGRRLSFFIKTYNNPEWSKESIIECVVREIEQSYYERFGREITSEKLEKILESDDVKDLIVRMEEKKKEIREKKKEISKIGREMMKLVRGRGSEESEERITELYLEREGIREELDALIKDYVEFLKKEHKYVIKMDEGEFSFVVSAKTFATPYYNLIKRWF